MLPPVSVYMCKPLIGAAIIAPLIIGLDRDNVLVVREEVRW